MLTHAKSLVLFLLLGLFATGCTHAQLRYNTTHQAKTLSQIYEQQVLDNLAMFCVDQHALPYFAYPKEGTGSVTDDGAFTGTPFNTFRVAAGLNFTRTNLEQWGLTPVSEPDKLKRMRCAYQRAVGAPTDGCLECCKLEQEWQGDPNFDCDGPCSVHCGWLSCGSRKDVPHDNCGLVGHYCGTYVWVEPCYRDHLTRLTLMILDYANNEPPATREKQVEFNIDEHGHITSDPARIAGKVTATIGINDPATSAINGDANWEKQREYEQEEAKKLLEGHVPDNKKGILQSWNTKDFDPKALQSAIDEKGIKDEKVKRDVRNAIGKGLPSTPASKIPKQPTFRPVDAGPSKIQMQRNLRSISVR